MRQLRRPGAGDSGRLFSYFVVVALLSFYAAIVSTIATPSSDRIDASAASTLRAETPARAKAIGIQAPKDLAVVTPSSYGGIRGVGSVVGYGQRRSLNDYEVEDFVLMATVNGKLSARDRKTGRERWQIHTEDAAVQTINHRLNSSSSTAEQDDSMTWIVEPSEDGELLFYTPEGGLEVCDPHVCSCLILFIIQVGM
jgi:serine/threonine-protein kinase/endoribonuclease IRE1